MKKLHALLFTLALGTCGISQTSDIDDNAGEKSIRGDDSVTPSRSNTPVTTADDTRVTPTDNRTDKNEEKTEDDTPGWREKWSDDFKQAGETLNTKFGPETRKKAWESVTNGWESVTNGTAAKNAMISAQSAVDYLTYPVKSVNGFVDSITSIKFAQILSALGLGYLLYTDQSKKSHERNVLRNEVHQLKDVAAAQQMILEAINENHPGVIQEILEQVVAQAVVAEQATELAEAAVIADALQS